jgi:hypothetical protein
MGARQELGNKVEKVAQQVSDSIGQQDALLPLLREMTETAAKREQEHQQQLDQIQEQWSASVKEIHRGHTMLQNATVRRQDELSAQVLALVQAISTLTVSVEDMQQDVIHKVQEQLLRPASRAIEAKRPEENEVLVQTSGEQLQVDHRPSMSDLEAKGKEQESVRIKLGAFARVARKLHQKAAFHGLCKAVYLQKAANFDWRASKSAPSRGLDILWIYYEQHGRWYEPFWPMKTDVENSNRVHDVAELLQQMHFTDFFGAECRDEGRPQP